MANLTAKELSALQDQLEFEHACAVKLQDAAQQTHDNNLRQHFEHCSRQHQQNFNNLLGFLK